MKTSAFVVTAFVIFNIANAQSLPEEYRVSVREADSLLEAKDYKASADKFSAAFKTFGWKGRINDRYNAARAWAKAGIADSAFFNLYRIVDKSLFSDYGRVEGEADFASLHADPRWQPLLERIKDRENEWQPAGSMASSYRMFTDTLTGKQGSDVQSIQSIEKNIQGFGTLMKTISSDAFKGKRVRMTGYLKTKKVKDWAGLWMRVDGDDLGKTTLAFDNMKNGKEDRSVYGTTSWKRYKIVLDVPDNAKWIAFGALLHGTGQIWFRDLKFEVVENKVSTTGKDRQPN